MKFNRVSKIALLLKICKLHYWVSMLLFFFFFPNCSLFQYRISSNNSYSYNCYFIINSHNQSALYSKIFIAETLFNIITIVNKSISHIRGPIVLLMWFSHPWASQFPPLHLKVLLWDLTIHLHDLKPRHLVNRRLFFFTTFVTHGILRNF